MITVTDTYETTTMVYLNITNRSLSMERTRVPLIFASLVRSDTVSFTFTITHGSSSSSPSSLSPLSSSLTRSVFYSELKTWLFGKSFPPFYFFLSYTGLIPRTLGPFNISQRLDLFVWCVRLSRLLVSFRTHFKAMYFHSMGVLRIFSEMGNEGSEGRKSPSRVQGSFPAGVWAKPQKLTTFSQNDA